MQLWMARNTNLDEPVLKYSTSRVGDTLGPWTAGHQRRTEAVVKVDSASQRRRRRIKLWKPLTLLPRHPKVLWGHALLDLDVGALHSIVSSGVTRFWMRIRHGRSSRPWESVVPQQQLFWFQTSGPEYSYMCWVEYVSLNWLCGTDSYALSSSSPLNRLILFYSTHHSFFLFLPSRGHVPQWPGVNVLRHYRV